MSRITKLKVLLKERADGEQSKLARLLNKQPAQISHWFTGHRPIGEKVARDIEMAMQLPRGWLDDDAIDTVAIKDEEPRAACVVHTIDDAIDTITNAINQLKPEDRAAISALLGLYAKDPASNEGTISAIKMLLKRCD